MVIHTTIPIAAPPIFLIKHTCLSFVVPWSVLHSGGLTGLQWYHPTPLNIIKWISPSLQRQDEQWNSGIQCTYSSTNTSRFYVCGIAPREYTNYEGLVHLRWCPPCRCSTLHCRQQVAEQVSSVTIATCWRWWLLVHIIRWRRRRRWRWRLPCS